MSAQTKVSGTWRNTTVPYIKISNIWKLAKSSWIKVGGDWKVWFLQGGVRDTPFSVNTGSGPSDGTPRSIAIQSDGKILLGGFFTTFNGVTNRLVRLNPDGTRDTAFTTNAGSGPSNTVRPIKIQSD